MLSILFASLSVYLRKFWSPMPEMVLLCMVFLVLIRNFLETVLTSFSKSKTNLPED